MNPLEANVMKKGALLAAALLLGAAFVAPPARADQVIMSKSSMVSGSFADVYSFTTSQAGTLTLRLENIAWPERLASLSCNLYDNKSVLATLATTGEIRIDLAGPGTYFSHLFAQSAGSLDLGLFSLKVSFQPYAPTVPLPAAVWLLGSVAGAFGVRRHAVPALQKLLGRVQFA